MAINRVDRYNSGCSWNLRFLCAIFLADVLARFSLHAPSMPPYRLGPTDGDEDDNANVFVFMVARRVYTFARGPAEREGEDAGTRAPRRDPQPSTS